MPRQTRAPLVKTDLPLAQRQVSMSNALARSAQALSLSEKRIISCAIASTDQPSGHGYNHAVMHGWKVRLTAMEYAETFGLDADTAYTQLKDAVKTLVKKQWQLVEGRSTTLFNWCSRVQYHDKQGWAEVEFTHYTAPHLLMLKKQFTTYHLKQASALRSIYAWRLFECLMSWRGTGRWTPTLKEFLHAMDAPKSCRNDFGQVNRRILQPALKELRDKDGWDVDCKPVKAGRKVTGLVFTFAPARQMRLELPL